MLKILNTIALAGTISITSPGENNFIVEKNPTSLTFTITPSDNEIDSFATFTWNVNGYLSTLETITFTWGSGFSDEIPKNEPTSINAKNKIVYIVKNETLDTYLNQFGTTTINEKTVYNIEINNGITKLNFKEKELTPMEELLTALTTAVQSAVSIFVEGFKGLTQIFYNGTEITFIGGILVVGLAVMFLMMFLRWIVSFVKGI